MAGGFAFRPDDFAQKKRADDRPTKLAAPTDSADGKDPTAAGTKGDAAAEEKQAEKGAKAADGDRKLNELVQTEQERGGYAKALSAFLRRNTLDKKTEDEAKAALDKLTDTQRRQVQDPKAEGADPRPPAAATPAPPGEAVPMPPVAVHLGSMRPQWLAAADGSEVLVLVRAAKLEAKTVYQGVVIDWAKLEEVLKAEVQALFPAAGLVPVRDAAGVSPERAMASLPVQLDPGPPPALPPAGMTPLRLGLVLAWAAAVIAFAAVGLSGWSLIDSSERRMRFVSAVTHELRTPLTSLRLYIDLLMSGMVEDDEKRTEYLATLNVESDRLHRLIDNVLDYARLEGTRRRAAAHPVPVADLLDQVRQTWADRCGTDGKELVVVSTLPPGRAVCTDPHLVHQIVGNLIDNARKYTRDAADPRIWLWAKPGGANRVVFEVEDRGPGVPARERRHIFRPFRRGAAADTRAGGAGLGLALARQWAEALGGRLTYRPADCGTGACFRLELRAK
jgi:signal transduction histidine kinase